MAEEKNAEYIELGDTKYYFNDRRVDKLPQVKLGYIVVEGGMTPVQTNEGCHVIELDLSNLQLYDAFNKKVEVEGNTWWSDLNVIPVQCMLTISSGSYVAGTLAWYGSDKALLSVAYETDEAGTIETTGLNFLFRVVYTEKQEDDKNETL